MVELTLSFLTETKAIINASLGQPDPFVAEQLDRYSKNEQQASAKKRELNTHDIGRDVVYLTPLAISPFISVKFLFSKTSNYNDNYETSCVQVATVQRYLIDRA